MSLSTARRWLWIAALVTMPVPFYIGELEWAPVLRLGFLTLLFAAVMAAEGGSTVIAMVALGFVQALVYAGFFRLCADLGARLLVRFAPEPLRAAAVGSAVFLLVATAQLPIYETPLSSARLRSNLWQLFE